jgi:hypothetical protein
VRATFNCEVVDDNRMLDILKMMNRVVKILKVNTAIRIFV